MCCSGMDRILRALQSLCRRRRGGQSTPLPSCATLFLARSPPRATLRSLLCPPEPCWQAASFAGAALRRVGCGGSGGARPASPDTSRALERRVAM